MEILSYECPDIKFGLTFTSVKQAEDRMLKYLES